MSFRTTLVLLGITVLLTVYVVVFEVRRSPFEPGSVFRGPVPARAGEEFLVWDYEITVGLSKRINHDVLGWITVVPITEKRKIFHRDYTATLVTLLEPKQGVSVSWTYTDEKGREECDLVRLDDKRHAAS